MNPIKVKRTEQKIKNNRFLVIHTIAIDRDITYDIY